MEKWEQFEIDCTSFLNRNYGNHATFTHEGGSNANVSDIYVATKTGDSFYIDSKLCPAQCGQFVLLADIINKEFRYSPGNASPLNPYSYGIMDHMNQHFLYYNDPGTAGKNIYIPNQENIFSNWVTYTYKEKGVRFIITNDYLIVPIDDFNDYFNITAKYRVKKSGSSRVGNKKALAIAEYIHTLDMPINNVSLQEGALFVDCYDNIDKLKFIYGNAEYMFSKRGNVYEVRKLSNTFNANVIFSISLKHNLPPYPEDYLLSYLKG